MTKKTIILILVLSLLVVGCESETTPKITKEIKEKMGSTKNIKIATFAGGCFWCLEAAFEALDGVTKVISGYAGGDIKNPTYQQVVSGKTKHKETVQIYYDPKIISYKELIEFYWRQIDPTDEEGSFVDRGDSYKSAIYYGNEEERKIAEKSKQELIDSGRFSKPIVTPIIPFKNFYEAEEYHQDYYKKRTSQYNRYEQGSGRKEYKQTVWGDEKLRKEELKTKLTPIQYKVTQEDGTEIAFENEYWNNSREGIYVDIVSGEPLFSSKDKFKSGTGWPSFTKPLEPGNVVEREDNRFFLKRTEVRSKKADSHLGHIFNDAPKELGGIRYCMNSAALRFIPKEDLEKEGYEKYMDLFEN